METLQQTNKLIEAKISGLIGIFIQACIHILKNPIIALLFLIALMALSCGKINSVEGNGKVVNVQRTVMKDFTEVDLDGDFSVIIIQDSVNSVQVEAESNLMPYILTGIDGNKLIIKTHNTWNLRNNLPVRIYVHIRSLTGVELSGSGNMECDNIVTSNISTDISGSGNLTLGVAAQTMDANISGSGKMFISGNVNNATFHISGSGNVQAVNYIINSCNAHISGSGKIYVTVNNLLKADISGSGSIYYSGNPTVTTNISGSGKVINQ